MQHKHITHEIIDTGDRVVCDACGKEYNEGNTECGGFLFGSYAYGPCCAVDGERRIQEYNEQEYIKARCPTGKSFREWVLIDLRGGDNRIHIITAEIK